MSLLVALILGIVEGLTEFLPVSSTGHLHLAGRALGLAQHDPAVDAFEIVIQLGAILAVFIHYRALLAARTAGLFGGDPRARQLLTALVLAFLPVAVVGLAFRKVIKAYLFGDLPVAIALIVGGIGMIVVERFAQRPGRAALDGLEHVTPRRALLIGLGQCFALVPGTSRSMTTIVTGQLVGLSTATAAEFSFLVAIPALGSATLYEGWKSRHELLANIGPLQLAIGLGVSFVVAWAALASFLGYLKRRGLEPFGYYRIVVGALVLGLVLLGR